jgi:4-diphosphocytidyl-2-C-methyl-D-erythritol kinase
MVSFPNAKINIGLDIVSRRPDGYHNIVTAFVPVPWCDVLEVVPAAGDADTLTVSGRGVDCPPEKNLVMKACRALRQRVDFPAVDIYLNKIIPDGAGLGGGSADAAFTVTTINKLFNLGLSDEVMAEVLAGVGSDCPFFVYNRPMLAVGTGTEMSPIDIDLSGKHILLVKPANSAVSTAQAYAGVSPAEPAHALAELLRLPITDWQGKVKNDFESSVFAKAPAIAAVKSKIIDLGAVYTAMSGSGACVFGIFDAPVSDAVVHQEFKDCDTFVASL